MGQEIKILFIQFTSEESTNTSGYRIDNVSLTGIAK